MPEGNKSLGRADDEVGGQVLVSVRIKGASECFVSLCGCAISFDSSIVGLQL